jgi:predicted HTH domain antitoxin
MVMTVTLPDIKMTEDEVKRELALSLYAARRVTLIQAADIAGVGFFEFQGLLRERKIPQHYGVEELTEDLRNFPRKN